MSSHGRDNPGGSLGSRELGDVLLSFGAGTLCNPPSARHTPGDPQLQHSTIVDEVEVESVTAIDAWTPLVSFR